MEEIELYVYPTDIKEQLILLLEDAILHFGLQIRKKGSVHTYHGSQHRHIFKPGSEVHWRYQFGLKGSGFGFQCNPGSMRDGLGTSCHNSKPG